MAVMAAPRVEVIEGRKTLVVERTPPIPPRLELLIDGGSGWRPLRVIYRADLRLMGTRSDCLAENHRLQDWLEGFHTGSDGVSRYLHLDACVDCGSVCVRDASFDVLPGLPTAGRPPRRKSLVIGWYSGARPGQREYH